MNSCFDCCAGHAVRMLSAERETLGGGGERLVETFKSSSSSPPQTDSGRKKADCVDLAGERSVGRVSNQCFGTLRSESLHEMDVATCRKNAANDFLFGNNYYERTVKFSLRPEKASPNTHSTIILSKYIFSPHCNLFFLVSFSSLSSFGTFFLFAFAGPFSARRRFVSPPIRRSCDSEEERENRERWPIWQIIKEIDGRKRKSHKISNSILILLRFEFRFHRSPSDARRSPLDCVMNSDVIYSLERCLSIRNG